MVGHTFNTAIFEDLCRIFSVEDFIGDSFYECGLLLLYLYFLRMTLQYETMIYHVGVE